MPKIPVSLTIAGSDPSGGAGIQADLKTFHQHRVYGEAVITLLTVQNTKSVQQVYHLDPDLMMKQLAAVLEDIPPTATKTGALGKAEMIDALCMRAGNFSFPLIVDPVMISKHGSPLLEPDASELLKRRLLTFAYLVTPNLHEATVLSERIVEDERSMEKAAVSISKLGVKNVLIKGGHLEHQAMDVLYCDGTFTKFPAARIATNNTHGTGCVYSAAITALLSQGRPLIEAVGKAKSFITKAIQTAPELGSGHGPTNMLVSI